MRARKPISGLKLSNEPKKAFASHVGVYQPSLFGEDNSVLPFANEISAEQEDAQAIQELNALITAQYDMSYFEKQLFVKTLEGLPPSVKLINGYPFLEPVIIKAKELMAKSEYQGEEAIQELEKATHGLIRQVCWIATPEGQVQVGLISSAHFLKGKGLIRIHIDPVLHPYLTKLRDHFKSRLVELLEFKSFYSKCLYDLFVKRAPARELYFPLDQLRRLLLIKEGEYNRYQDIKRFIIQRAQKDMLKTPYNFTFTEKRGDLQKVLGVIFQFTKAK